MLKVLGHPWHAAHNYELLKLPFDWHYLSGDWHSNFRPFPDHVRAASWDFQPQDYDLILTHFSHESWGYLERLRAYSDRIPVIAICHGVPTDQAQVEQFREMAGDILVVCNCYEQEAEWNFRRSRTIIHGFDPEEWPQTDYSRMDAVVSLPGIPEDYPHFGHNYGIRFLNAVRSQTKISWIRQDKHFSNWNDYRNYLRHSAIYFNPTLRSPMPRARGEAMMMGLVPVTRNHMGEDRFIDHGENGFLVEDPETAALIINHLRANPQECKRIGRQARETALECFSWNRWAAEWQETIEQELSLWPACMQPCLMPSSTGNQLT